MTLSKSALEWAADFISNHSDGDLFPMLPEMEAIINKKEDFINLIEGKPLASSFPPGAARRFIVPKDDFSYRQATQLDPQDSIILSAIIYQYGQGIEDRRLTSEQVFSYRFNPEAAVGLYSGDSAWNNFWTQAYLLSQDCEVILYCDIADFYNQIYHHVVENQLIASNFPNQAIKWIISLLESTTAGVSRGVPVGPHAVHLIAEATLIPVDQSLQSLGFRFIRFADDIVFFCESESVARATVGKVASTLDKQQRLMLQRHKTRIYNPSDFQQHCSRMIEDRPISDDEESLLRIIRQYSNGNPYQIISYSQINPEDWIQISEATVRGIIEDYLSQDNIDYVRLRWFYRRLSQVGHPGAISVSLENIDHLGPCFANICLYLSSIQAISSDEWKEIGGKLLDVLGKNEVQSNEYFGLSILSLFGKNASLNHLVQLIRMYSFAPPFARREILLAAKAASAYDWIREHKEDFLLMDPWQQRAMIYCISSLPKDEKNYFINNSFSSTRPFDITLAKWSKSI